MSHLVDAAASLASDGLYANLVKATHEQVAVFGVDDGLNGRAQYLHAIFLQHSFFVERDTAVECRLTTKCEQDAIGTFLFDDALDELGRYGLEIHRVGYGL